MELGKAKVVQLSSVHPVFDTRIFHKICKSLVANGYDVDLIIQHSNDEVIEGINIRALPIAKRKLDRPLKIIPLLFLRCIEYPPNTIFHFHDPELIPVGIMLKMFGYIVIYDAHENTPKDFLTKEWFPIRTRRLFSTVIRIIELLADKYLDSIITTSKPINDRYTNKNLFDIRNYPILSSKNKEEVLSRAVKKNQIIYIGSITYRRGIKEMVSAMSLLDVEEKLKLKIGGKFSPPSIYDQISKMKGWEKCEFIGWQTLDDIWINLSESKIGLVTIQPNPSHFTQLPVKLFEYMAAGLPVICSDFPMYREIVESSNCGLLVNPMYPEEIKDAIEWLNRNPKQAQKMGKNGRKAILEKYNWANEQQKLLTLYSKLRSN